MFNFVRLSLVERQPCFSNIIKMNHNDESRLIFNSSIKETCNAKSISFVIAAITFALSVFNREHCCIHQGGNVIHPKTMVFFIGLNTNLCFITS
ncbi:hypothetical protein T4A_6130 [Trichinella pseudospiralis]|uniref:Uncharacterized protein n=1 Tax=Trichinella pseudospiralis TaxID=6337 RepID=A0A0V1DZ98_TRIPS|nr:hypothetical protein T4A_6130 [Trichinella pseudospiralis]